MKQVLAVGGGSLTRRLNPFDGGQSRTVRHAHAGEALRTNLRRWSEWTTTDRLPSPLRATESALVDPVEPQAAVQPQSPPRSTGLLYDLPRVAAPEELLSSALKRARRVSKSKKLSGPAAQARNLAARRMDTLMKGLTTPLTGYLKGFPLTDRLHGFEAALLNLTVSEERYLKVLARVLQLRKTATTLGKEYASRGAKAESKKGAERIAEEGFAALEALFVKHRGILVDLLDVTRKLRQLPKLDLDNPVLALVGAPNVGKSSLVQAISSGKPEICNYPFTTRSIQMGHFYVDGRRYQVTDTPGLLNRPEEEKNSMELLTLATLRFLPTAVIFILDATEHCGTSLEEQLMIRSHLREQFPNKPWMDVFSKADLLKDAIEAANHEATASDSKQVAAFRELSEGVRLSCFTQEGMEVLKEGILGMFQREIKGSNGSHSTLLDT